MRQVLMYRTGGPEVLQLCAVPSPVPGPGDAVVEATAIGVGWPDILIRTGSYRWMPPLPTSPGSDMSGHVVAVGPGVDPALIGAAVLVTARELKVRGGCYAERIAVPADALFLLPPGIDLDAAVCLPNYQVAWNLIHEAPRGATVGSVFISGAAGGVGSAAAQLAKAAGMKVLGSVSSAEKAAFAARQGVECPINYRQQDVVRRVLELTGGLGVDLVLDHRGGPGFAGLLAMLAPWGTLVSYNASAGLPQENLLGELRRQGARCLAVRVFEMHLYDNDRPGRRRTMQSVIDACAAGRISPEVSARLPLEKADRAHAMVERGEALGKIILKPSLDA
jgi:NADPH2:quinone reductase